MLDSLIVEESCCSYVPDSEHVCSLYGIGCDDPVAINCPFRTKKRGFRIWIENGCVVS